MSNFVGKVLIGAKAVGAVVGESAKEMGKAVGDAATTLGTQTKQYAHIAVLKAEMEDLTVKLGKSVFENGLTPDNAEAMEIMSQMFAKDAEITAYEAEVEKSKASVEPNPCDEGEVKDDVPTEPETADVSEVKEDTPVEPEAKAEDSEPHVDIEK